MPGSTDPGLRRQYSLLGYDHRYGFNGKEGDDEVKGDDNQQDYGMRIYDPRAGRFLSVDPITSEYPELTPYQFASNTPIMAIDLDGLEAYPFFEKNTHFISLRNVNFTIVKRESDKSLTMSFPNNSDRVDYSINTQMYDRAEKALYKTALSPQPVDLYTPQGYNVQGGNRISGRSANKTSYIARDKVGKWTTGMGDVPADSDFGLGGGTPIIIGGLKYGTTNIFSEQKDGMLQVGTVSPEHQQYLLQKSNGVYTGQNGTTIGKTILAYRSSDALWKVISQENNTEGFLLDEIRDHLANDGFDHVIGFDGSNSATLSNDGRTLVAPALQKDNTMPTGLNLSVPQPPKKE